MWFFSKKTTIAASGILQGAVDHHSHILPGVDDGVETMDEALRILATYEDLGIKELWLTPHIMEDIPNSPQKLKARFEELQAAYSGNIQLHLAAEYMIDNHLRKLLNAREGDKTNNLRHSSEGGVLPEAFQETPPRFRGEVVEDRRGEPPKKERPQGSIVNPCEVTEGSKTKNCPSYVRGTSITSDAEGVELLPIGSKGNHLLVETSYYNPPMRFRETLRQIKSLGYHPLLAHPERYMYMDNDEYRELHDEGVRFQLNLPSLCGAYGNTVKKRALWLLKNGLYDAIGSDTHCEEGAVFLLERKFDKQTIGQVEHLLHNSI